MTTTTALYRPLLLGFAAGLRSQLPLAVLAWSEPVGSGDSRALRGLRSTPGRFSLAAAAAGELVADKLPSTPSRLKPPVLGGRVAAGAAVGALAAGSTDRRALAVAGGVGAVAAVAGSYAGAFYRRTLPAKTHTPDLRWAVGEDAVAAALAATAVKVRPLTRPRWRRVPFTGR